MTSDETRLKHESFGYLRAARVQSTGARVFDSALRHQHYVTVSIGEAELVRHSSENHVHGGRELISVRMSESQFATFITSLNVGSGAPCTLEYVNGVARAGPPPDLNTRETFAAEVSAKATGMVEKLAQAISDTGTLVVDGRATKKQLSALHDKLLAVKRELVSNLPFLMKQFAEGIEKLTDRAKADLNAHAALLGQRLVLDSSKDEALSPVLSLSATEEDAKDDVDKLES